MRRSFVSLVVVVVFVAAGCPVAVEVPPPVDAGPQVPDAGPGGEGEGEVVGEGEGEVVVVGEGEGEIVIIGEGEGEAGEGEGEVEEGPLPPGVRQFSVDVGGDQRTVQLVVPATVDDAPLLPVIIAVHGNGDNALDFLRAIELEAVADAANVVFAVPDGFGRDVVIGDFTAENVFWDPYTDTADNVDIAFFDALIDRLVETGEIDPRGIHVLGYSQGGFMAYRYGLERSNDVGSVVVVSAGDPFNDDHLVTAALRPLPFRLRCGSEDAFLTLARDANTKLTENGHATSLDVVNGAGHVPFPVGAGETIAAVVGELAVFQRARPVP
jgi:poly(3-hydroxybutyrate) depolymerase